MIYQQNKSTIFDMEQTVQIISSASPKCEYLLLLGGKLLFF